MICISNLISTLRWPGRLKSFLVEDKDTFKTAYIHGQYHCCWSLSDERSQGISDHDNGIIPVHFGVSIICSTVYSGADQRKHQSSASLAYVRGIHRWPVDPPHKGPVTRNIVLFHDVIMYPSDWSLFRWRLVLTSPFAYHRCVNLVH